MMLKELVYLLLVAFVREKTCARILAVVPVPSYSHQLFFRPLWKGLNARGHELTLMTTDPMPEAPNNIKQIDWSFAYDLRHNKHNITKVVQDNEYNLPKILASYQAMMNEIVDEELARPEVQALLNDENERFDLLMVEYFHPVMFAFSERFKCPYIALASMEIANFYHKALGNPIHPVLYPEILLPFERDLKFSERLLSTLYVIWGIVHKKYTYGSSVEELMAKKYFGEDLPSLQRITRNVSMVFVNTHPVFNVRPLGPGFVRIGGGMHLEEPKPLPEELKMFLDRAGEGVIYFSLGTNVRSHHLSKGLIQAFVDTFRELPYKVLWKFERDVPEKSSNVKIVRWLPQQDVLRHKNVILFMTQCGSQSMEEAIFSHVPMVAIPFVSDQKMNAQKIVGSGLGLFINKNTLTREVLMKAILEITQNSSYKNNVRQVADLMQDQPMSGLEKAIWWTEYVIRHRGVKHFWHPNLDLPTYQFLLLDVIGFLVLLHILTIFVAYKIVKNVSVLLLRGANSNKVKTN
ncbi:UDP-glucuronosyltransferase 2B31 [Anoplophora glabripennis]|nr:UDP-glucuronosyltransferase 2B31 [Anoplophora glabripennis]